MENMNIVDEQQDAHLPCHLQNITSASTHEAMRNG